MRRLYFLISFLMIALPAKAQILNIDKMAPTLELPAEFLDSLETCSEYNEIKSMTKDGIESKIRYIVREDEDKKCFLLVVVDTDYYVHIEQACTLPRETAAEYADALRQYTRKKYSLVKDTFALNKDKDYLKASEIMQNSDLCRFTRDEIDNTKELRRVLRDCKPIASEEKVQEGTIYRRIEGPDENSNCLYYFTLFVPKPDISKLRVKSEADRKQLEKLKDKQFTYRCSFDNDQRIEYTYLLRSLVLPEEEGYDFTSVSTFSHKIELAYILHHCEYVIEPKLK